MARRRRNTRSGRKRGIGGGILLGVLAILLVSLAVAWFVRNRGADAAATVPPTGEDDPVQAAAPGGTRAQAIHSPPQGGAAAGPARAVGPDRPAAQTPVGLGLERLTSSQARELYEQALALRTSDRLIEERDALNRAYFSGHLTHRQAQDARNRLTQLAEATILSSRFFPDDPYNEQYIVSSGDTIAGRRGIERSHDLRVPSQLLVMVNRLPNAQSLRAGQRMKLVRGPAHAVVYKGEFAMDLYLHREGFAPVFLRRLPVGLGRDDATPVGLWKVEPGKKLARAAWNPPQSAGLAARRIEWGHPDYPLGREGYWISLVGLDDNTRYMQGYGIHGTNEPRSIGRAESLGCIRLGDDDIEFVFSTLYEEHSTVRIAP